MLEHFFQCPYCWEEISFLLDSSISSNEYIEDCEICCNPIETSVKFENEVLISFEIKNLEQ
ncbi:MAG: transcription elongation factor Elf1 [Candidatus Azotimanducaceae bacterium]|jgi:transcription elongation factor Elf1